MQVWNCETVLLTAGCRTCLICYTVAWLSGRLPVLEFPLGCDAPACWKEVETFFFFFFLKVQRFIQFTARIVQLCYKSVNRCFFCWGPHGCWVIAPQVCSVDGRRDEALLCRCRVFQTWKAQDQSSLWAAYSHLRWTERSAGPGVTPSLSLFSFFCSRVFFFFRRILSAWSGSCVAVSVQAPPPTLKWPENGCEGRLSKGGEGLPDRCTTEFCLVAPLRFQWPADTCRVAWRANDRVRVSRLLLKVADECQVKVFAPSPPPHLPCTGFSAPVALWGLSGTSFDLANLSLPPSGPGSQTHLRGAPLPPCFVFLPASASHVTQYFVPPDWERIAQRCSCVRTSETTALVCEGRGQRSGFRSHGSQGLLWMSSVIVTALQSVWLPWTLEVSSRLIKSLSELMDQLSVVLVLGTLGASSLCSNADEM